jgi:hypothetical protein
VGDAPLDVKAAAAWLGCQLRLGSSLRRDGIEATLRPHPSQNRFYVTVDPTPRHGWEGTPRPNRTALSRQRFRFRACHELGHALHFERRPGHPPSRRVPWRGNEELWCDEFARALLVPPDAAGELSPTAASAFDLQKQFDVSLELALRALVAAHPGCEAALWFWPANGAGGADSLIRQWSSAEQDVSLYPWLSSPLVAAALTVGEAAGSVRALADGSPRKGATVCAHTERRQVLLVAPRSA